MQEFQQRVVTEKEELDAKRVKLESFLKTSAFNNLGADERNRMWRQSIAMKHYSLVLGERIAAFEP